MNFFRNYINYLKNNPERYWFKRKLYGWGWTPVTWEGWIVLLVWAIVFIFIMTTMNHDWVKNMIAVLISIAVLIYICYKKGEKPKWQWGPPK